MSVETRLRNELSRDASFVDVDVDRSLGDVVRGGKRRQRLRRVSGAMVVMALIAGVATIGPGILDIIRHQRNEPASPTPTAPIVGTYTTRLEDSDPALRGLGLSGQWQLTLRSDGVMTVTGPLGAKVSTSRTQYQLQDGTFLTSAFASETCSGVGVYRWFRDGATLTLTQVSDACDLRVALLASHPWTAR